MDSSLFQTLICLERAIRDLTREIGHHQENQKILFRIEQMEGNITMKISDLGNTFDALSAKVTKISTEQQTQYDALVIQYEDIKTQLSDAEISEELLGKVNAFSQQLDRFDEKILDTTPA